MSNTNGSLHNPYIVVIRDHERKSAVYRYLIYKGIETVIMGMLTRGQRIPTIDSLPGIENGLVAVPNLPLELARRQGLELAIGGQVEKASWFIFEESPDSVFFRDSDGEITLMHSRSTGKTTAIPRSSVSKFVNDRIKEQEDFEKAVQEGRAI